MHTKILKASEKKDISTAISLLQAGELVAVPTETVYGLAADAKNIEAVNNIFIAKNRPQNHPLIVHIHSVDCLKEWARDIPLAAYALAQEFWPGPLTLLLHKHPAVNNVVTGGRETIALRVPKNPVLLNIIETLKTGLAAPSANLHKRISPTRAEHVLVSLDGRIAAVLDAGACAVGLESTIVDLTHDTPRILRPGPITRHMLEHVLQAAVNEPTASNTPIPGNMRIHYKPQAETILLLNEHMSVFLADIKLAHERCAFMYYSDIENIPSHIMFTKKMSADKESYARDLYQALHELDSMKPDKIFIEAPPEKDAWADVWDRLSKACAK